MNLEKNRQFEEQLRRLRPMPVNPETGRKIDVALQQARRQDRIIHLRSILAWGGFALAASILLVFGVLLFNGHLDLGPSRETTTGMVDEPADPHPPPGSEPEPAERDGFKPILAENNLKSRVDEGIVFLNNGLAARRYRYEFIDRIVWRNPADGAVMEMEIPRDELVLVPVQTF